MNGAAGDNLCWATALLEGMASCGLRRLVISPGSRSTPLALAAVRHPLFHCWVTVDERSAAFFALGMAKAEMQPVALIATSGSAPAHWYPAVIEASQSAIPLLLLSADRPPELQGCGANQTIDQQQLFGCHVRHFMQLPPLIGVAAGMETEMAAIRQLGCEAVERACSPLPGPVHLNIPLREPLVPQDGTRCHDVTVLPPQRVARYAPPPEPDELTQLVKGMEGVGLIICGPEHYSADFAPALTTLAQQLGSPILADPLSGLRFGSHDRGQVICHYDAFMRRQAFCQRHYPDWVLRFGAMPISKSLASFLEAAVESRHYLVDGNGRMRDPLHHIEGVIAADPTLLCQQLSARLPTVDSRQWFEGFMAEEQRCEGLLPTLGGLEAAVIRHCIEALPPQSILFSSNSMPIRDLDSFSGSGPKPLQILANRGVSGIDGNISTLLGLAAVHSTTTGVTLGLIGDLALFHDMNGLMMAREVDAIIVLFNNNGGGIFHHLPQVALPEFERLWKTPTQLDFSQVARLYQLEYQRLTSIHGMERALQQALQQRGVRIIELVIDAGVSLAQHRAYWQAVAAP